MSRLFRKKALFTLAALVLLVIMVAGCSSPDPAPSNGDDEIMETGANRLMYEYGVTSLINDDARVFKGGGWKDRPYWMVPGTRRFLDQNEATNDIGFRCAMIRVGSPVGY